MEKNELIKNEAPAIKPDYSSEIAEIIKSNDTPKSIMTRLEDYHESDIADVFGSLYHGFPVADT
ncbi:MAG: hypothetical protein IKO44_02800 [Ruminococcus sp.]|nr:hypothetical protein [Ruminococcus sp.]